MKKNGILFFAVTMILSGILFSCTSSKKNQTQSKTNEKNQIAVGVTGPPVIVYKTKKDYYNNVPVTLSEDKSRITSFPAQSDIRINGQYPYPTRLNDGYLLDNRGINKNTAFLRFTYEDYYIMDNIPTADRLMNYIIDDDPFMEIYECGKKSNYDNLTEMLNRKIETGELGGCEDLMK